MLSNGKIKKQIYLLGTMIAVLLSCVIFTKREEMAKQAAAEAYHQEHSYFEDIKFCGSTDELQGVRLFEVYYGYYFVFLPGELFGSVSVDFSQFQELCLGSEVYRSGDQVNGIVQEVPYTITAKGWDGSSIEEGVVVFYYGLGLPSVYVESESGSLETVNNDREVKEKGKFSIVDEQGKKDSSGNCTIHTRGNSSFQVPQKSYSFNIDSESSLLGMSPCSEWTLLANFKDSTHQLKNKMVLDIAKEIGMPYTPENHFVNLYVDGQYNGVYLLAQKVSADGGSVKIHDLKAENEMTMAAGISPEHITGGYLLEFDARYEKEPTWFQTKRTNIVVKTPKEIYEEQYEYISSYMQEVEDAVFSEDGTNAVTGKSYEEYIDTETWTRMYLMQDFFVQWDVEFASFYLYKDLDDPKIYAGPVWDFDLAFGTLYHGEYPDVTRTTRWIKQRGGWLGKLASHEEFNSDVEQKYQALLIPALEQYLEEEIETIVNSYRASMYMSSTRWQLGYWDVDSQKQELVSWVGDRMQFMQNYLENPELYEKVTAEYEWGKIPYYVLKSEEETMQSLPYN